MLACIAVLGAAGPLAGCTSTQQKAARLQLSSARLRAEQVPTKVGRQSSIVHVSKILWTREGKHTAFVVTVANDGRHAVSDLPILVGYRDASGGDVFVNGAVGTSYFAAHLPLIEAGKSLRWVVTTTHAVPAGATALAEVGARPAVAVGKLQTLPQVSATAAIHTPLGEVVSVKVHNGSGVTQYALPLYAVAESAGQPVAAGTANVAQLNGEATQTIHIHLFGDAQPATSVHVETGPTIFN